MASSSSSYSVPSISTVDSLSAGNALAAHHAHHTRIDTPSARQWLKAIWTYLRQTNQTTSTTSTTYSGASRWNRTRQGSRSRSRPGSEASSRLKPPALLADVMATNLSHLCLPAYNPLNNHLNQNPCEVARALLDACNNNKNETTWSRYYPLFALGPLGGTTHNYQPPAKDQVGDCMCSMTTYNLIQACAACQFYALPSSTPRWDTFTSNCSMTDQRFARPLQDKDQIPGWAWADNSNGALNVQEALLQAVIKQNAQHRFNSSSAPPTAPLPPPSSSASSPAAPSQTAAAASTSADTNSTASSGVNQQQSGGGHGPRGTPPAIIAASVLSILFSLGLIIMIGLWIRHRRRVAAHGKRLGSSDDLHRSGDGSSMMRGGSGSMMRESERNQGVLAWLPATTASSQGSFSRGARGYEGEEEELGSEMSYATNSVSTGGSLASERGSGGGGARWLNLPYGHGHGQIGGMMGRREGEASTLYTTTTRSSFDSHSGITPLSLGSGSGSRTNYSSSTRDPFDDTYSSAAQDDDASQSARGGGGERSSLLRGSLAKPPRVIISSRDNLYHSNVETRIEEIGFYSRPRPRSLASSTGATYGLGMRSDSEGEEDEEDEAGSEDGDGSEGSDGEEQRFGGKARGRKKVLDVDLISLSSGL